MCFNGGKFVVWAGKSILKCVWGWKVCFEVVKCVSICFVGVKVCFVGGKVCLEV